MLTLYPPIKPYARHNIPVSGGHKLYVDESGNPEGIPVLFLHGGPGAACDKHSRRFFDPQMYRIIIWDQRGCGRSEPHAEVNDNTMDDLVADMETIRKELKVDRWLLFGGSAGSTLALIYAARFPACVLAMVLRGIFLARERDIDWLYGKEGAGRVFPDHWEEFASHFSEKERDDVMAVCQQRLTGKDELARMGAAKALCSWYAQCSTLRPSQEVLDNLSDPHRNIALARVSVHYMHNRFFLDSDGILPLLSGLEKIPGIIVHGRYDLICPLDNAYTLQKKWPGAKLHIVRDAGHSASESGIRDALVRATDEMARRFKSEFGLDKTS